MNQPKKILVFQTAFLGDVVLTLPMIQRLQRAYPTAEIDVVTTPAAADLLRNHPAISTIIHYDKRKAQSGLRGIIAMAIFLQRRSYDLAIAPHRSLRTALILALAGIPERIGFSTASGKFLYHRLVRYVKEHHEIERDIDLLSAIGISPDRKELPSLFPSDADEEFISKFLFEHEVADQQRMIAIAPGSVWATKRWPAERFAHLAVMLADAGYEILIIGGKEDRDLAQSVVATAKHKHIYDTSGQLTLLQSAELIGRCRVLVTNDSAPLHMGVAMGTPVAAIFGATVPAFGFGPYGEKDIVIETNGLTCRPCAIHGGKSCPIKTFDCMKRIEAEAVFGKVTALASL